MRKRFTTDIIEAILAESDAKKGRVVTFQIGPDPETVKVHGVDQYYDKLVRDNIDLGVKRSHWVIRHKIIWR
jgi:hypothetical protein